MSADVADHVDRQTKHLAPLVEGEFANRDHVAALIVAQKSFRAVACPLHRALELMRRPRDRDLLGIEMCAQAERAADILRDDVHVFWRQIQHIGEVHLTRTAP